MEDFYLNVIKNPLIRNAILSSMKDKEVLNFGQACSEFRNFAVQELNRRPPTFSLTLNSNVLGHCMGIEHLSWIGRLEIHFDNAWSPDVMQDFCAAVLSIIEKVQERVRTLRMNQSGEGEDLINLPWMDWWNKFPFPRLRDFELCSVVTPGTIALSQKASVECVKLEIGITSSERMGPIEEIDNAFLKACPNIEHWDYFFSKPKRVKEWHDGNPFTIGLSYYTHRKIGFRAKRD